MAYLNAKTATALVGTVALATSAVVGVAPALADSPAATPQQGVQHQHADARVAGGIIHEANVQGTFGYDQSVRTSSTDLSHMFMKAAATLCTNMPAYFESISTQPITVSGTAGSFNATVADLAGDEDAEAYDMACSCASNVPGGGAIANAEVRGVSLASIADKAQAR